MNQEEDVVDRSCLSNEGHLIRELRVLRSLSFERIPGSRFYLTLVNSHPGQIGLALEVPRVGKALVFLACRHGGVRFMLRRGPQDELMTLNSPAGEPVSLSGPEGDCLRMSAIQAESSDLSVRFTVPTVGQAMVTFRMRHDRARLEIVADKDIRILPSPGAWN